MTPDRWQRFDRLFVDALQRAPDARAGYLSEACGDDDALRLELQSLLTAAETSGSFMEGSAFDRLAQVIGRHGSTLTPGEQVGPYAVMSLLGAGGAGEVWRARDTRLARDVAIKVLLPHLSRDAMRARRFADEARAVGSLNHPNIVAVHDVGEYRGAPFLVSEYLDGQTLRTRLGAGPMRPDDVVATGLAIARGLAAAHARGIVHRDLKPENVFITRATESHQQGAVKILDFGVAKLQTPPDRLPDGTETITGVIVGTAGYMAPEQVRGERVDARVDLFALGVMMYEMLTGATPFKGASVFETLHAIATVAPPDVAERSAATPEALAAIVMRLLRKDRDARFHTAADLVWALERVAAAPHVTALPHATALPHETALPHVKGPARGARDRPSATSRPMRRRAIALAAAAAIAGAAATTVWFLSRTPVGLPPSSEVTRFTWPLPTGVSLISAPAVAPDGRHVAFTGRSESGTRLYVRALDAFEAVPIDGTDGAQQPFWSADSQWIGFFSRARLMKVAIAGGAPIVLADTTRAEGVGSRFTERGGAWGRDGLIVFGSNIARTLTSVSAAGGSPAPATRLATRREETMHRFPSFLPDGRHFLYQSRAGSTEGRGVFVGSVDDADAEAIRILPVATNAVYVPAAGATSGLVLYVANGRIEAQRFDPARHAPIGSPQPLGIEAGDDTMFYPAAFSASSDVLAYATQFGSGSEIAVASPDGRSSTRLFDRREQQWPRISPDGTRMAWLVIDPSVPNADIWVADLARGTRTRVTTAPSRDLSHVWSPDGRRLAYRPDVSDQRRLTIAPADGSEVSQDLVCPMSYCEPSDWSSDGRELIVNAYTPEGIDVWTVAIASDATSRPLLQTRFNERDARLSPDRRWLAYVSDEAGRPEVSVRRFDASSRRQTVSPGGGDQVVWQRDGRALYYVDPRGRLRKVSVREVAGDLSLGQPVDLPITIGSGHANTQYDVAPDGRIFYLDQTPPPMPTTVRIVLGWQRLLK